MITRALDRAELSPRELAVTFTDTAGYFVSESSVYRLLKAPALITRTAFIVMKAAHAFKDKTTTINQLWQTGFTYLKSCDQADAVHKPRLLSDNGSRYISGNLADGLTDNEMSPVRGAPYHPQTHAKTERWHHTLKNRIWLENCFLPSDLEQQSEAFVEHYNHQRYHESLKNLTPADVYFGHGQSIRAKREKIKRKTIAKRRLHYQRRAA